MYAFRKTIQFIDVLNEKIGHLVSWLTTILVIVVCYDVLTRYFLKKSTIAVQELEWHLFSMIFLIGAAYTLKHNKHVRVDVFYVRFPPKIKAWINFLGSLLLLIPFSLVIIWTSKDFVITSFLIHETSPDPGGLPGRFLIKGCIPLSFFLLLLQSFSQAFKSLLTALGKNTMNLQGYHD